MSASAAPTTAPRTPNPAAPSAHPTPSAPRKSGRFDNPGRASRYRMSARMCGTPYTSGPSASSASGYVTLSPSAIINIATPSTAARFSRPTHKDAPPLGNSRSPVARSQSARSIAQSSPGARTAFTPSIARPSTASIGRNHARTAFSRQRLRTRATLVAPPSLSRPRPTRIEPGRPSPGRPGPSLGQPWSTPHRPPAPAILPEIGANFSARPWLTRRGDMVHCVVALHAGACAPMTWATQAELPA